ncbi:hypothetical protein B9Z19DRAFT_1069298 [Tuber borchii]|uniref:Uncharacterized protein n=1 Tax=Tuber borchii TaxID=42251 RepID=A0A2T6ZC22_TUBBO|nr:hypothetical protein B9Z19DRAFT_1069298 [Tuber borchii]
MYKSTLCNPTPTNPHSTESDIKLLSSFSSQQIDSLHIPQNRVEIEQQELIALATLTKNNSIEWGLKRIVSNLALADIQHKRGVNRTRIPTSGKAWVDHEDIARFFESQSIEERKATQMKYHHATNLVTVRCKKLAECTHKRKETEDLEEEGKLPKHRKPSATLREEETRLTKLILEAQQKVEKFEKHLQDLASDMVGESQGLEGENFVGSPEEEITSEFDEEQEENLEEGAGAE